MTPGYISQVFKKLIGFLEEIGPILLWVVILHCWVIEATPKSKDVIKETGYLKTLTWIRKDIFFGVKGRILVKKGKKVKLWSAKDIKKIDGVWVAKTQQMTTTKKKKREHSSIFIIDTIAFNKKLNDSLFESEAMQRGY